MEIYKFLGVKEILQKAIYNYDIHNHAAGSMAIHSVTRMNPWQDPTPSSPWVSRLPISSRLIDMLSTNIVQMTFLSMGQNNAETILRAHLSTYGVEVELGTALSAFHQDADHVTATLIKTVDGNEQPEQIEIDWLIGADGARGVFYSDRGICGYTNY